MKLLTTMFDEQLKTNYDLYLINLSEITKIIKNNYKNRLNNMNFHFFNNESISFNSLLKLKAIESGKRQLNGGPYDNASYYQQQIEEELSNLKQSKYQQIAKFSYEVTPLSISVKDKNITNEIELLDGFKKLFYHNDQSDREILLKVYDKLSNKQWINAMLVFHGENIKDFKKNMDSTSNSYGHKTGINYIDTSFRMGLFTRYQVDFIDKYSATYHTDIFRLIDLFTSFRALETMWNNEYFTDDIKLIYNLFEYRPSFNINIKNKTVPFEHPKNYKLPLFLEHIYKFFISAYGEIRRQEYKKEALGEKVNRKPFVLEEVNNYFKNKENQEWFSDAYQIYVDYDIYTFFNQRMEEHKIKKLIQKSYFK